MVVCRYVCLSVSNFANKTSNLQTDLHEIFGQGWQWASEEIIKFSPSGYTYRDCFPDLSLWKVDPVTHSY